MARPQAADYEQRKAAILDEAARLFARQGFRGSSIADLAAACGMSKSLIYHYYPSKEDILHAVMASHIDQLEEDVAVANTPTPAAERLRAVVQRFMEHYSGAAARQTVLLNEMDNLPPARRDAILHQQRTIVAAVTRLLAELDPALAGDPTRARVQAMLLFGMINWTHTWFDPAGTLTPRDVADMALALVLREP